MQPAASWPYQRVLVAFDGSDGSTKALRQALQMAGQHGAEITVLIVDEHLPRFAKGVGEVAEEDDLREQYFADLQSGARAIAAELGFPLKTATAVGHAAQSILRYAGEQGVALIAMGHSGHSGVWGTLLGSTTARVVDQAECAVLVVR